MRPFRIPRPPPGMPPRMRNWYVLIATAASLIIAAVPMCPVHDPQGRPLWRVDIIHDGDTVTCIDEGIGNDESTATDTDHDGGILHRIELRPADESARVVGESGGQDQHVGTLENRIKACSATG